MVPRAISGITQCVTAQFLSEGLVLRRVVDQVEGRPIRLLLTALHFACGGCRSGAGRLRQLRRTP